MSAADISPINGERACSLDDVPDVGAIQVIIGEVLDQRNSRPLAATEPRTASAPARRSTGSRTWPGRPAAGDAAAGLG